MINYLKELYGNLNEGFAYTFELPSKRTKYFKLNDLECLVAYAETVKSQNVYVGLCPSKSTKGSGQRPSSEDALAQTSIVVDLDVRNADAHAQTDLPPTKAIAAEWLKGLDIPAPSLLVDTGNGVHAYWHLSQPLKLNTEDNKRRARDLSQGLNKFVIAEGKKKGWKFDNVGDLARIVRLPGTANIKTSPPKFVEVIERSHARYNVETLEQSLPKQRETIGSKVDLFEGGASEKGLEDTKPFLKSILAGCEFAAHCVNNASTLPEPDWKHFLAIVARCENGRNLAHKASAAHPDYDYAECDKKIDDALNKISGATTCSYIAKGISFDGCERCPFYHSKGMNSPIALGFAEEKLVTLLSKHVWVVATNQFCEVA